MIDVTFPPGYKEITAAPLTEWDYGQKLRIFGLTLPQTVQIHFCDQSCAEAIVRLGNTVDDHIEVVIPDCLLENKYEVHAFIFVTSYELATGVNAQSVGTYYTKNGNVYTAVTLPDDYVEGTDYYYACGKSLYKITIPVIQKTKPENFIDPLTPDEQTMLEEMINAVNSTFNDIEALYDDTITVPDLQQMIKETTVDNATNVADKIAGNNITNIFEVEESPEGNTILPKVQNATHADEADNATTAESAPSKGTITNDTGTDTGKSFKFFNTNGFGTSGNTGYWKVWDLDDGTGTGTCYCGIVPSKNNKQILGTSDRKIKEVWATSFKGNADSANKIETSVYLASESIETAGLYCVKMYNSNDETVTAMISVDNINQSVIAADVSYNGETGLFASNYTIVSFRLITAY